MVNTLNYRMKKSHLKLISKSGKTCHRVSTLIKIILFNEFLIH